MISARSCLVLILATSTTALAQVPSTLRDAAVEVALEKVLSVAATAALGLEKNLRAEEAKVRADYYAANLATLVKASGGKRVKIDKNKYPLIFAAVVEGKKIQYEIIAKYLVNEAAKVMPRLARLLTILESFAVATTLSAFSMFLTPTELGFGQAFEFCDARTDHEKARTFIERMLGTYEPARFAEIATRRGCADAMLSHLEMQ